MAVNDVPVTTAVDWDHEDAEMRFMIAIHELAKKSLLSDEALARTFDYLARRAKEDGF